MHQGFSVVAEVHRNRFGQGGRGCVNHLASNRHFCNGLSWPTSVWGIGSVGGAPIARGAFWPQTFVAKGYKAASGVEKGAIGESTLGAIVAMGTAIMQELPA